MNIGVSQGLGRQGLRTVAYVAELGAQLSEEAARGYPRGHMGT